MIKNKSIRVFLSRPNPFTENQKYFIEFLKKELLKQDIETITLVAKDYSPYESLTILNEMIKRSYGMIILAFGHTFIENGTYKKGAENNIEFFEANEEPVIGKWITSSFCQIEGAMAISNNIPIMVIKQENLKIDGILKRDKKISSAPDFSLCSKEDIDYYIQNNLRTEIKKWRRSLNIMFDRVESKII